MFPESYVYEYYLSVHATYATQEFITTGGSIFHQSLCLPHQVPISKLRKSSISLYLQCFEILQDRKLPQILVSYKYY